jgi:hypothetical protein
VIRDDLSDKLIHLTRGDSDQQAAETFLKILDERRLRGGTGCIKGSFCCVCFSEAPISKLGHILAAPGAHGMRYSPFGVMVSKSWLFARGGRPVIYQSDREFKLLHADQQYRHVRYEPADEGYQVDFTWEREWRIRVDELTLEPPATTVVVPTRAWEHWFMRRHQDSLSNFAAVTGGFTGPDSMTDPPWHFIVLEDLGVPIPAVAPPPRA